MNKNVLIVVVGLLLMMSVFAQDTITQYSPQDPIILDANILKLGYSPDQQTLVELIDGVDQFYVYRGYRRNDKQPITINDGGNPISPATFAFSSDNTLLVVGSKTGSIYGFDIVDGVLNLEFSYKYTIIDVNQNQINSITISPLNKIAIGAGISVYILTLPTDGTGQFVPAAEIPINITVTAVAWKNADENTVLVGCAGVTGLFTIYDIAANTLTDINTDSTSSIAVVNDGRVFQGRVNADIQIWSWDGTKYNSLGNITNTIKATQITIDTSNRYFAAQINAANILAWKIDTLTQKNLQSSQLPTLPTRFLNETGIKFALTGNGNQILVVSDATAVVNRFSLCNDGNYYNNEQCLPCENKCKNCFDNTTCLTCPKTYFITDNNICTSCGGVTPGCLDCSDSTTCTACDPQKNRVDTVTDGVCACNAISYPNGDICTRCVDSIDFCESCDDAQHCTVCYGDGNINPEPQNFTCDCQPTWYLENKTCLKCNIITGCINCKDSKTCTLCDDANSFEPDGNGGCQCKTGNWYNQDTFSCVLCSDKVPGCQQCQQDGTCTVCQGANRVPNPENTQCVCRSHTFENLTNECQVCDTNEQCLQCTEANNCSVCDTTKHRDLQPVNGTCLCKAGFIESNTTHLCLACTVPGCSICAQDQVCQKCFTSLHFQELAVNGLCVCQSNYHPLDDNSKCLTCGEALTGCTNCDNLKECTQCDDEGNFELNSETKTCQCKASFYQLYKDCNLCSEKFTYCQNCNKDQCQQCKPGFILNQQQNTCDCSSDRNLDEQAGTCEEKPGLSALAIIAIIVGILALAGAAVAAIKYFKKRQSPLEDGEYESLESKDK